MNKIINYIKVIIVLGLFITEAILTVLKLTGILTASWNIILIPLFIICGVLVFYTIAFFFIRYIMKHKFK